MRVELLYENEESLRFILRGSSVAFANALRRAMIAEVPTMAIDDVIVLENSSVLYDEVLAHRLGLIPLRTDLDSYVMREECDCKSELGCSQCTAVLTLDVEAKDGAVVVFSRDLVPQSNVVPVKGDIPIVKLVPGQKIKLEAYARLGRGREHAKWQPVTACVYKYLPKVTVYPENLANADQVASICPRRVFDLDPKGRISVRNELACTLCMDCVNMAKPKEPRKPFPVKVEWEEGSFVFYVEPSGALPTRRLVMEACKILGDKAEELERLIATSVLKA